VLSGGLVTARVATPDVNSCYSTNSLTSNRQHVAAPVPVPERLRSIRATRRRTLRTLPDGGQGDQRAVSRELDHTSGFNPTGFCAEACGFNRQLLRHVHTRQSTSDNAALGLEADPGLRLQRWDPHRPRIPSHNRSTVATF
jgi:hypothetical protein